MLQEKPILELVIKKDFFVKSRKDNIKDQLDFISVWIYSYLGSWQRRIWYCVQSTDQGVSQYCSSNKGDKEKERQKSAGAYRLSHYSKGMRSSIYC